MYRQRTQKAWGHTARRGWARLLLDRAWDLAIHGPAHRGANGAAMPTDENDQDGHFFFNHPERGGYSAAWVITAWVIRAATKRRKRKGKVHGS